MFIIQYHMISLWLFCQVYVIHHACKLQDSARSFSWVFSLSSCIPTIAWLKYWVIELLDLLHLILPYFQVVGSLRFRSGTSLSCTSASWRTMMMTLKLKCEIKKDLRSFWMKGMNGWFLAIIDDSFQSQAFWGLESWQFRDKLEMSWPLSRSQKICPSFCLKVGSQQGEVFLSHRQ